LAHVAALLEAAHGEFSTVWQPHRKMCVILVHMALMLAVEEWRLLGKRLFEACFSEPENFGSVSFLATSALSDYSKAYTSIFLPFDSKGHGLFQLLSKQ